LLSSGAHSEEIEKKYPNSDCRIDSTDFIAKFKVFAEV